MFPEVSLLILKKFLETIKFSWFGLITRSNHIVGIFNGQNDLFVIPLVVNKFKYKVAIVNRFYLYDS